MQISKSVEENIIWLVYRHSWLVGYIIIPMQISNAHIRLKMKWENKDNEEWLKIYNSSLVHYGKIAYALSNSST